MSNYLKLFATHSEYQTYAQSGDMIKPNVSYCEDNNEVHYNPWVDTRIIATFNVTDINTETTLLGSITNISQMEIDSVVQPSVISSYTFGTTGEHTVKYTLIDPTYISDSAFYDCIDLISITIPNTVTFISDSAFGECGKLTSIIIPNSVTSIGNWVFSHCNGLSSVSFSNSMTSIGEEAFSHCYSLTSISIPNTVTSIGYGAFYNSGLTSVTIGNSLISISDDAFFGCSYLTSVTIGNSVTSIGDGAFNYCSGLTSITIPNSVTSIGSTAFEGCGGLNSIICNATTAPTIESDTFQDVKTSGVLYVPQGSTGYDVWMGTGDYYLGLYNWTKVEQ